MLIFRPMLSKTRAISLSFFPFKESSVICRFFTEEYGLQSLVVNGVRSAKSKIPRGLFQPFSLLEVVQYHDQKKDLHRLKEIKQASPLVSIPFSAAKSAMVMFCAEILGKVVREGQSNLPLFEWTWSRIERLDQMQTGFDDWHVLFLRDMLKPLGLEPESGIELIGDWLKVKPIDTENILHFLNDKEGIKPGNAEKQWMIDALLAYLQRHLEGMGSIRSLQVLREVFA